MKKIVNYMVYFMSFSSALILLFALLGCDQVDIDPDDPSQMKIAEFYILSADTQETNSTTLTGTVSGTGVGTILRSFDDYVLFLENNYGVQNIVVDETAFEGSIILVILFYHSSSNLPIEFYGFEVSDGVLTATVSGYFPDYGDADFHITSFVIVISESVVGDEVSHVDILRKDLGTA